jgi:Flp pilus assembly protein TadG
MIRFLFRAERGQALPIIAVCFVVIFGFVALAVDVGAAQYRQRMQQTAADAAAIAGATQLEYSSLSSDVTAAAQADATANGFTTGTNDTVTVNWPPVSGHYIGSTSAVQVVISSTRPNFFGGIIGQNSTTVATTATAILTSNGTAPCVYQLDPHGQFTENSGVLYAPTCGIIANGASTYNNGTITAATVGYAGTLTVNSVTWGDASPAPSIPATDPCAQISGCAYLTNNPPATTPCLYNNLTVHADTTLRPGVYCGGITVDSSNIVFNPGVYVLTGDFTFNGANTITGTGVTFVMDSGSITMNGNGTITLSAPTTGSYANALFYQPKANTSSPTLNSGHDGSLTGALYFPGATITGNSSGDAWTLLIAASITLNSASLLGPNGKGMSGGVANAVLAE